MRKVAGIYGPRHSLTVAAAKVVRAARVAVAGVAWETSCALPASEGESGARSGGERARKVVRFKEGAEFWGDFCDRKKEEEEKVARTEEGSGGGGLLIGGNAEAMKSREMIITQRLWGPLGERGRKQRDFKRSASESYVPGRWAPPPPAAGGHEGWLDTSGRAMSYDEFWGGKEGHGAGVGKVRLMEGLLKRWVHAGVGIGGGAAAGVAAGKNKESEKERLEKEMLRESRGVPGAGLEVD
ncbi:hypothetical protein B0J12DRAFT_658332 [Macrophomina phaseolina]|uniref:Uncharacterized protein n=1 Tax=Macrophomina phaseolina TaxID=35725 RepID=A0ABQ8GG54_9PEZI|nr:hypothetical protein B0J12DRAFT_658332 [Macrophomina phaseolina]